MFRILIVCMVLGTALAYSFDDSDEGSLYMSRLRQMSRERAQVRALMAEFEEFCPGKSRKLQSALNEVGECARELDLTKETFCHMMRNDFMRCMKPVKELLQECLPEESSDVPETLFGAIEETAKYICKTDGEHILELGNHCLLTPSVQLRSCKRQITEMTKYMDDDKFPTKKEFCSAVLSSKTCLHQHLVVSCRNTITREAFDGLFNAITAPCAHVDGKLEFVEIMEETDREAVSPNDQIRFNVVE